MKKKHSSKTSYPLFILYVFSSVEDLYNLFENKCAIFFYCMKHVYVRAFDHVYSIDVNIY